MDNAGDVVGGYDDANLSSHGYLRSASGAMAEINDPRAADIRGGGTVPESTAGTSNNPGTSRVSLPGRR